MPPTTTYPIQARLNNHYGKLCRYIWCGVEIGRKSRTRTCITTLIELGLIPLLRVLDDLPLKNGGEGGS